MKQLIPLIIIAAISGTAQAVTISPFTPTQATAYASQLLDYSHSSQCNTNISGCDFTGYTFDYSPTNPSTTTHLLNGTELAATVTVDTNTFTKSTQSEAWLKLGFDSNHVVTGTGADLVIFSIGNGYNFGLQAFDASNQLLSNFVYSVPADGSTQAVDPGGNPLFFTLPGGTRLNVSATSINLLDSTNTPVADNTDISYIKLFIGTNAKYKTNNNNPLFSLAGAFHVATVPIPLPIILFSSGLALLGWAGRKKTA